MGKRQLAREMLQHGQTSLPMPPRMESTHTHLQSAERRAIGVDFWVIMVHRGGFGGTQRSGLAMVNPDRDSAATESRCLEKSVMKHDSLAIRLVLAGGALMFGLGSARAETTIVIAGSQRMVPLLRELAKRYEETHADVRIEVKGGGSEAGVNALAEGAASVASLARPITDKEALKVRFMARHDPVGVPIAMDAVALFVHPANPLESLTVEQVSQVFSRKITLWDQLGVALDLVRLDERGTGSTGGRSDEAHISMHMPPETSGSRRILEMRAMMGRALLYARMEHEGLRDVVNAVAVDRLGLGLAGAGYSRGVKVLGIRKSADSPAILPSPNAVRSREYPFSHYLYLYFAGWPTGPVRDFLRFATSAEGQRVVVESATGVVALPISENKGK
jgi:phosphate transport system substrate-binding protein